MHQIRENLVAARVNERLTARGFRFTRQRQHVYGVLAQQRDHPTAEEVFLRAKKGMPDISLATVYNCLEALVASGLIRQVRLQRGAARYCANMQEHAHYHCDHCGAVFDVPLAADATPVPRPHGFQVDHFEIAVHGLCAECAKKR